MENTSENRKKASLGAHQVPRVLVDEHAARINRTKWCLAGGSGYRKTRSHAT